MGNQATSPIDGDDEPLDRPVEVEIHNKPSIQNNNSDPPIPTISTIARENSNFNSSGQSMTFYDNGQIANSSAGVSSSNKGKSQPNTPTKYTRPSMAGFSESKATVSNDVAAGADSKGTSTVNNSLEEKPKYKRNDSNHESLLQKDAKSISNTSSPRDTKKDKKKVLTPSPPVVDNDNDDYSEAGSDVVDDESPVDILLQFIPYYGQGDPANDSIVRSTLSVLSVEDIDSKDEYGNTLLLLACQYRCEDLVRIMLNKGANPNAVNQSGACCLHFACYQESASYQITKILLQNGANPDVAESTYGCTPLHYCAGTGDIEFCKLLLSYGAQIDAVDFYNYTCVDYAREAGMNDLAYILQGRLDKALSQAKLRNSSFSMKSPPAIASALAEDIVMSDWSLHTDPSTGSKYYMHTRTGEVVWEQELLKKYENQEKHKQPIITSPPVENTVLKTAKSQKSLKSHENEELLAMQAIQSRLIAFLGKHDPARLVELESLLQKYKGKEQDLLKDLCNQYKVEEDPEFTAFQHTLNELKSSGGNSNNNDKKSTKVSFSANTSNNSSSHHVHPQHSPTPHEKVTDINQIDPALILRITNEARNKFESELDEEKKLRLTMKVTEKSMVDSTLLQSINDELKIKYDNLIDEEKNLRKKLENQLEEKIHGLKNDIIEKESIIAKIISDKDSIAREKTSLEDDNIAMKAKIERLQLQGGEAMNQLEKELSSNKNDIIVLKEQLSNSQQELLIEKDKLKSLELSLSNLTLGKEEMIAKEKAAAEERANQQREREAEFNKQIQDLENKRKGLEIRMKSDFNQAKNEWMNLEKEMRDQFDQMKKMKDKEIDVLRRELDERKSQFATEISSAQLQIQELKKQNEEYLQRVQDAEASVKSMQDEIAESKVVQKYNAQLHKDLQREQLARKKLHNDMEDLKGKIRVYVRVRPFSKTERDKNCTEAVIKDGKMTVMVKGIGGPDGKKVYDFDQVFGGQDGNSQADVFRDTKHLIMSVVDGYNVCIFAYGQTGAGKSFTMIGAADIAGITPRAVSELFRLLNERTAQVEYVVEVQMFQLYRDGLDDLLVSKTAKKTGKDKDMDPKAAPLKITLAEHSSTGLVNVEGAETMTATTPGDVMKIFAAGSARRTTASTQMNAESSRSHLICSLVVKLTNRRSGNQSIGKLTLVDLAGSERVDKSGAAGEVLKEAQSINKSLSALGDVISALTTGQQHIPYRNHPLTMLMSDSIGGNAKTLMFVNTSPADYNNQESNSSLAFAARCKDITNAVAAGPGVQAAQMSALKKELAKLKKGGGGKGMAPPITNLERPQTAMKPGGLG
eukprot:gene9321-12558_t